RKRVIRSKIVREGWMKDDGLNNVMELIKRQKWENLFKRREFVFVDAVKEFYARMTVTHLKKRDVVKSSVKGVAIEFNHDKLASILGVPGKNGICEYIKDVWEESKYTKPLEITRRFANDETLMAARRVKSGEMKPFQRFIHFLVMKNVVPRFGKRDTSSIMDLTYMDHPMSRRLVNLPRVMMRHMSYVISMKDHELPYEAVVDEAAVEGESGSGEKFYDAEDEVQGSLEVNDEVPAVVTQASAQQKEPGSSGVDPSCPTGRIPEAVMNKLQAEFERARANRFQADLEKAQAENARLLALLQQAQTKPKS
ncbi:hypothetical protein Dimus_001146, partial [Dionaea muscipula]